jgi:superfamily II DNA or RNA helicase/intein/homing endonuclease
MQYLSEKKVKKAFTHRFYDHSVCRRCDNFAERHNFVCDKCDAYHGTNRTYSTRIVDDVEYIGLPLGERNNLEDFGIDASDFERIDLRCKKKFDIPVKLLKSFQPRDYQKKPILRMAKKGYGVLEAPPRSGKCVTGDTIITTINGTHTFETLFEGIDRPAYGEEQYIEQEGRILTAFGMRDTSHIYRKWADKTVSVRTESGHAIRGVEEHPLLVLTPDLTYEWKYLRDIEVGDYLCMNRTRSHFPRKRVKCAYLNQNVHLNACMSTYPKTVDEDVAALLGYLVANGSLGKAGARFSSNNEAVQKDFIRVCESCFDKTPSLKHGNGKVIELHLNGVEQMKVLAACGLKLTTSATKEIPFAIMQSPRSVVMSYLTAYFSCDSSVSGSGVGIMSASHKMMKQLQILMTQFGLVSFRYCKLKKATNSRTPTLRPYYGVSFRGIDADNFHSIFDLKKPQNVHHSRARSNKDYIPYLRDHLRNALTPSGEDYSIWHKCKLGRDHHYLGYEQVQSLDTEYLATRNTELAATVDLIRRRDMFYSPVVSVTESNVRELVYDVTVPEGHHYLGNGIVSHNTPMMLMLSVRHFKYRTILIADQREFLDQFLDHVVEFSNLPMLQERTKKKLFGYVKKPEDCKHMQIAVCTYQSLLSEKGKKLLKAINKNFGAAFVDEVHASAAMEYSTVLNKLNTRVRIGVTGTPARKDSKYKIVEQVIGKVQAVAKIDQLQAKVYVHILDYVKARAAYKGKAGFARCTKFLSKHAKRNAEIIEWVLKDLEKGHSIVIPVYHKDQVFELVKLINDNFGRTIAAPFVGGASTKAAKAARSQTIEDARSGKIRVVVGIRSLMQRGINVERWSMLYCIQPINNAPNWKQESSRILTPSELKRSPGIRLFVDPHIHFSLSCFIGTYKQTVKLKHIPTAKARKRAAEMFALKGESNEEILEGDFAESKPVRTSKGPGFGGLFKR